MFFIKLFGKVYDVTKYLRDHPGGEEILLQYCSEQPLNLQDRGEIFLQYHRSKPSKLLKSLPVVRNERKICLIQ